MDQAQHDWHIIVLTIMSLCILSELIILSVLSYKFCTRRNADEQHAEQRFEFNKSWTVIFILLSMFTAASDFVHIYIGNRDDDESIYSNKFRFIVTLADFFYFVYTIQLYLFLIYRVYSIFKETPNALSTFTIILFAILFAVNFGLMVYYLVIAIQVEHDIVDGDTFNPLLWIPMISMDILINVVIMTVMIRKLRNLIIENSMPEQQAIIDEETSMQRGNYSPLSTALIMQQSSVGVDNQGQMFVEIMSKFCVLSAIIVIFNQIFGIWLLCTVIIGGGGRSVQYVNVIQNIGYAMRDIEGLVDCFVVYLTFKMNEKMYNQWCCCCHTVLYKVFITNIKNKIQRQQHGSSTRRAR